MTTRALKSPPAARYEFKAQGSLLRGSDLDSKPPPKNGPVWQLMFIIVIVIVLFEQSTRFLLAQLYFPALFEPFPAPAVGGRC